jgi:hypothetical protein
MEDSNIIKKEIKATSVMQLIDINGEKVAFQSDCLISTKDSSKNILIAIVNQDELDNGDINFEPSENGKYGRRVTYQDNIRKNHFLCIKKKPSEEDVECDITIRMKEIPIVNETVNIKPNVPRKIPDTPEPTPRFNYKKRVHFDDNEKEMSRGDRKELQQKLQTLRESREYYEKDDRPVPQNNPYYQVSLICLFLFIIIMSYKMFNKQ